MSDLPPRLVAALQGRYALERELGDALPDGRGIAVVTNGGTARLLVETDRLQHIGVQAGGG